MKTVRKTLLASAITVALAPASAMADTTLFGNFDIAVAVESAEETALAVTDSPAGDNVIGVEGSLDLDNGNAVTYQYVVDIDLDGDGGAGFLETYHAYVGYKWDATELRAGVQDLPERLVMDKVDQFAGTYADHQNLIGTGTTADSSLMLLGGNDTVKYAVSADVSNGEAVADDPSTIADESQPAVGENSNNEDANDGIRYGGMIDFAASENVSLALGFETLTDTSDKVGLAANIGLSDNVELTLGYQQNTTEAGFPQETVDDATANGEVIDEIELSTIIVGISFGVSDTTTLKAQFGTRNTDISYTDLATGDSESDDFDSEYFAIGADFAVAENVTTYVLAASGSDGGLVSTGETDDGDASVFAGGIKLSF